MLLCGANEPETGGAVAVVRDADAPVRNRTDVGIAVPAAAALEAGGARRSAARVGHSAATYTTTVVPVPEPLFYVSAHIV